MDATMSGSLIIVLILVGCGFASARYSLDRRRSECNNGDMIPLHGTGCRNYKECLNGYWSPNTFDCPSGLYFNIKLKVCDWDYNIDFSTCETASRPNSVEATNTPFTTTHASPYVHHGTTHNIQCGNRRCYNGWCYYRTDCYSCPHYNHNCKCWDGYTGESCSQKIDIATSGPAPHHSPELGYSHICGNLHCYHASCNIICDQRDYYTRYCTHSHHHCSCNNGYTGQTCTLKKVSDGFCYNIGLNCHQGHCVEDLTISKYACHCNNGYTGDTCQLRIVYDRYCYQHGLSCHHGYCIEDMSTSNYACHCADGYSGDTCQLRIVGHNECQRYGLLCDHGDCVSDSQYAYGKHWCNCYHDFTGQHCNETANSTPHTVAATITSTPSPTTKPQATTTIAPITSTAQTTMAYTASTTQTPQPSTTTATITTPSSTTTKAPNPTTTMSHTTTDVFSATPLRVSTSAVSTLKTTTSPSNSSPLTTTVSMHFYPCNKINTVLDIGNHVTVNNTNVASCPTGSFASPEAFVLEHCQTPQPSKWTQGINVMQQCHSIPLYTPVATFINSVYTTSGSLSGILLGCLPDGFKVGVQQCDHAPDIIHVVTGGLFTMDPNVYHTIQ